MMQGFDGERLIDTGTWQRNRGRQRLRFREASQARAPDSPAPGECRDSTNGPARRRILLTRADDRALFDLDGGA